jgi:hypothetical protein
LWFSRPRRPDTRAFIDGRNDRCHPVVWTKTAEKILQKANRDKGHERYAIKVLLPPRAVSFLRDHIGGGGGI